jgi:RND family efflux transporter MFP subunit
METTELIENEKLQEPHRAPINSDLISPEPAATGASRGKMAIGLVCAAIVLGAGIMSGIHSRMTAEAALATVATESSIPMVRISYPQTGPQIQKIDLPGNVQAFNDTPIYARTSGYLQRWYVDIGSHVRQGQLMAEIETPELDQQLQQAQADLKTAQANLDMATITSKRWQNLLAKHAVSQQETDQALSDLAARQDAVAASQANLRRMQQLQSFERITAPFDGIVTARNIDIGALVEAGANTAPKELFHLSALSRLRVYVAVPEVYSGAVSNGAAVTLTEVDHPGEDFKGILVRNSNSFDPQTRTLTAEADVDNASGRLLPGAYVLVHLQLPGNPHSVTLPSNALLFRAEGLRAAVVRQNRIVLIPVTIAHDYGRSVEIVSGLTPQDAVVLDPPDSLAAGMTVKVLQLGKQGA